jgi:hypothetical protein
LTSPFVYELIEVGLLRVLLAVSTRPAKLPSALKTYGGWGSVKCANVKVGEV